jgi:Domain of unknown function (DUF4286)
MIVYNITIKITPAIETDWLQWQQQEHIPEIMATGIFTGYQFYRLLEQDEPDGITYVVQYFTESMENYQRYLQEHALSIRQKAFARWNDQFIAFRTVMERVN